MAVSFTPNIALAKPDETELAKNWVLSSNLQDDNNEAFTESSRLSLTPYTPLLIGANTNPSVGAGALKGEYQAWGGFIWGNFTLEFVDPGVSAGSGEIAISLPFKMDPVFHAMDGAFNGAPGTSHCVGEGYIQDASATATSGTFACAALNLSSASYVRIVTEVYTGKSGAVMTSLQPFVLATGDKISGNFFYKQL